MELKKKYKYDYLRNHKNLPKIENILKNISKLYFCFWIDCKISPNNPRFPISKQTCMGKCPFCFTQDGCSAEVHTDIKVVNKFVKALNKIGAEVDILPLDIFSYNGKYIEKLDLSKMNWAWSSGKPIITLPKKRIFYLLNILHKKGIKILRLPLRNAPGVNSFIGCGFDYPITKKAILLIEEWKKKNKIKDFNVVLDITVNKFLNSKKSMVKIIEYIKKLPNIKFVRFNNFHSLNHKFNQMEIKSKDFSKFWKILKEIKNKNLNLDISASPDFGRLNRKRHSKIPNNFMCLGGIDGFSLVQPNPKIKNELLIHICPSLTTFEVGRLIYKKNKLIFKWYIDRIELLREIKLNPDFPGCWGFLYSRKKYFYLAPQIYNLKKANSGKILTMEKKIT